MTVGGDTVRCFAKPQALNLANKLTQGKECSDRLDAALQRENKALELWMNTSQQLEVMSELNENYGLQIKLKDVQIETHKCEVIRLQKTARRIQRKATASGFILGAIVGAAAVLVAN